MRRFGTSLLYTRNLRLSHQSMATDAQARRDIALLQETVVFQSQMINWANVQIRDLKLEISAHHAQIE